MRAPLARFLVLAALVAAAAGLFWIQRSLFSESTGTGAAGPAGGPAGTERTPSSAASPPGSEPQGMGPLSAENRTSDSSSDTGTTATLSADSRLEEAPFSYDESETPDRSRIRQALTWSLTEHFVDYRLSSDEIDRATDALLSLREAQEALRALPFGPETADERRALVERIAEASSAFEDVLDVDPAAFTAEAAAAGLGGGGIDSFDPQESVPPAEFIGDRP